MESGQFGNAMNNDSKPRTGGMNMLSNFNSCVVLNSAEQDIDSLSLFSRRFRQKSEYRWSKEAVSKEERSPCCCSCWSPFKL